MKLSTELFRGRFTSFWSVIPDSGELDFRNIDKTLGVTVGVHVGETYNSNSGHKPSS